MSQCGECPKLCVSGFRSVLFPFLFSFFSALKKENARRTEWQTGPWPLAILQVSAIAGPHF
jgi:hypothetical protein